MTKKETTAWLQDKADDAETLQFWEKRNALEYADMLILLYLPLADITLGS